MVDDLSESAVELRRGGERHAVLRVSFARRSSTSWRSALSASVTSVVIPAGTPASTSSRTTQLPSVAVVMSSAALTARRRSASTRPVISSAPRRVARSAGRAGGICAAA